MCSAYHLLIELQAAEEAEEVDSDPLLLFLVYKKWLIIKNPKDFPIKEHNDICPTPDIKPVINLKTLLLSLLQYA